MFGNPKRFISKVTLLLIILFFISPVHSQDQSIDQIIDGDTFLLENGEIVRMLGIDAPERGQPGYDISRWFLYYVTEGENIRLERDEKETDKDDYGRLLRYVFLEKNQKMINELMLYLGLADFRYLSREAKYFHELEKAAKEAEEKKHGLWIFNVFPPSQIEMEDDSDSTIPWYEAKEHIDQVVTVEGLIVRTYDSGKVCFLNFHPDWQNTLNIVIFSENYHLFPEPPAELFYDKRIRVIGLVQLHQGMPQIIIKSLQQIKIIDDNN